MPVARAEFLELEKILKLVMAVELTAMKGVRVQSRV